MEGKGMSDQRAGTALLSAIDCSARARARRHTHTHTHTHTCQPSPLLSLASVCGFPLTASSVTQQKLLVISSRAVQKYYHIVDIAWVSRAELR